MCLCSVAGDRQDDRLNGLGGSGGSHICDFGRCLLRGEPPRSDGFASRRRGPARPARDIRWNRSISILKPAARCVHGMLTEGKIASTPRPLEGCIVYPERRGQLLEAAEQASGGRSFRPDRAANIPIRQSARTPRDGIEFSAALGRYVLVLEKLPPQPRERIPMSLASC